MVKEKLRIEVQAQGTVSPMQETSILSEVNGRIIEASPSFTVGGFLSKDDVLLRIDPRDYETHLLRAEAALKSAQSNLAQEKGRAQVAENEWQRLPKGSQRSQEAKDLYLRKPQLDQARAQMLAAQADLNTAKDNIPEFGKYLGNWYAESAEHFWMDENDQGCIFMTKSGR